VLEALGEKTGWVIGGGRDGHAAARNG
jgi:hypothetical protein